MPCLTLCMLQVIDTGAVLLESACSTDRVHEALATTLQLVPGCQYFRWVNSLPGGCTCRRTGPLWDPPGHSCSCSATDRLLTRDLHMMQPQLTASAGEHLSTLPAFVTTYVLPINVLLQVQRC